jgi:hypothetical protein
MEAPMEVQEQVQAPVEAVPPPEPAQQARTVPLAELMEERHKRQLYEREKAAAEREAAIYRQFIEAQRQTQQAPPIDPVTDPEGAFRALAQQQQAIAAQMQEQALHQRANMSEMLARREHGSEVDAAVQAAVEAGLNRQFMAKPDPYAALMQWHKSQQVAKEVGTDINAFRSKIEQEVRAKLLAEMKTSKPAPQNLPPSFANSTKAANSVELVTDANDFFKNGLLK